MSGRLSPLAGVNATRDVLEDFGLVAKKALGQHFLIDDGVVQRICALADLQPEDEVLEIGPGIGTLTTALLQKAGRVVAVERDADLVPVLEQTTAPWAQRFDLICADALEVQPQALPFAPGKLVSNLPYAVAATLVLGCFERFSSLQQATVMVQAEVADRMAASPGTGNYGAFTVKLALFARCGGRFQVVPRSFFPPPRVNSTVLRLDRIGDDGLSAPERAAVMRMADASFANRRKTIANSCKVHFADRSDAPELLAQAFDSAGIDPRRRGETLTVDEFKGLGRAALSCGLL